MSTNIIKPNTQVNNISIYDDSKPLNSSLQTDSTSLEDDIQGVLSVLNAIKDATLTGKWYDDIFEVNAKKRGIKQLNVDLNTLEIEVANLIIESENYYLVSASFNTATGLLTMTLNNEVNVTVNLDGRYIESLNSHSVTELNDVTSAGSGSIITTNERTKLNNISVTQPVDLDTMESDVAVNNAKISNATHTGDVTGSQALTISDEAVTNPKLAHIATGTVKGRTTAGTGDVEDLDIDTTLKTALNLSKNDVGLSNVQNVDTTNASNIADGSVSNTEFQYLANVTSDIQAQIDAIPNEKYLVSASFNALDGALTLTLNDTSTITANFDGRYLLSLIEDTTPQLGGDLDLNEADITGTGNIEIDGEIEANLHIGPLRGEICFNAKAGEAIGKGDPVYISNFDTVGNTPVVGIADADNTNKMPSFGLAKTSASLNASVTIVTFGTLDGINTSSFALGDILYISTTGTLTNQPPTGETALIQNIGKVMRSHASNGSIKVGGAGRSNDTPNLNDGNVFIGNASNQAESRALTLDDVGETSTKKILTDVDQTKLNNLSVTQPVDLDTMESDVSINNAKISNATHTGDVTGSEALTIANNVVDNNNLSDMAQGTVKARTNVGTGDPQDVNISTTFKSALGLIKDDVGLSNVLNVDQTNASNITTGTLDIVSGNFRGGLNVGYTGGTTDDRIKIGDANFYIDRGNSNLPLVGFDPNDYIAYNRTGNKLSTVIGGSEIAKTDSDGIKLRGNKALVIGDDGSDTPATTPPAQLYLGGTHNAGYNIGTKIFADGYDNETSKEVMKFRDENDNIDLLLESGINYPTLTMRGQTVFNEADRTTYGPGVDLNNMKTAGIYMVGVQATNLPPQRDTNESSYTLVVYTWGEQNGVQILYCTDRDSTTRHNAIYSRCWESTLWTNWNCVSSTPETLCDLNVSIGSSYTNFTVSKPLSTITTRYKQLLIMFDSSIHDGSLMFHAPFLAVNETFEYGKYSTRYVNFKTPTSTSSTTWQAIGSGVTVTRIRMIGYR